MPDTPEPTPERVAAFCCSLCHGPWEEHVDQAAADLTRMAGVYGSPPPTRADAEAAVTSAHCRRPPYALVG